MQETFVPSQDRTNIPGIGVCNIASLPLSELYIPFEGIGNNCEFGIVQRNAGYDPPGLFRNVGFWSPDSIIAVIESGLSGMFDDGNFQFIVPEGWPDWRLDCSASGMGFHTGIPSSLEPDSTEWTQKTAQSIKLFRFLKRSFLQDLRNGEKIFVFRYNLESTEMTIKRLHDALQIHGENWLLYVTEDFVHPSGWIELRQPRLIIAGIQKLSSQNPPIIEFPAWEKIARASINARWGHLKTKSIINSHKTSNEKIIVNIPPPPLEHMAVQYHIAHGSNVEQKPVSYILIDDLNKDSLYSFELWIYIPESFTGEYISALFWGVATEYYQGPDLQVRNEWQRVVVSGRTNDKGRMLPSVVAKSDDHAEFFSAGWRVFPDTLRQPTVTTKNYRIAKRSIYEVVSILDLIDRGIGVPTEQPNFVRETCLPSEKLQIADVQFGDKSEPTFKCTQYPYGWNPGEIDIPAIELFTLKNAIIHGESGVVTIDNYLISESLKLAGLEPFDIHWEESDRISLPAGEPLTTIGCGAHIFCGYPGNRNYAHFLMDIISAALIPPFHFAYDKTTPVLPAIRSSYQEQYLNIFSELLDKAIFLKEESKVFCRSLKISTFSFMDAHHFPHSFHYKVINGIKNRVLARSVENANSYPKKIYISRMDSRIRPLENEKEIQNLVSKHNFACVSLSQMSVVEQIELFSNATHIVAPHGAGNTNILFCAPGAKFLELHCSTSVQWSMRRINSLAKVSYGCIIGYEVGVSGEQWRQPWKIDLKKLEHAIYEMN